MTFGKLSQLKLEWSVMDVDWSGLKGVSNTRFFNNFMFLIRQGRLKRLLGFQRVNFSTPGVSWGQ